VIISSSRDTPKAEEAPIGSKIIEEKPIPKKLAPPTFLNTSTKPDPKPKVEPKPLVIAKAPEPIGENPESKQSELDKLPSAPALKQRVSLPV
jgi:hypothetical protein